MHDLEARGRRAAADASCGLVDQVVELKAGDS
jgi:hypothetical protein